MSERGVFALDRGWFNHPAFADEPFTEREAWAWLIAEAAWKPRRRRIGSRVIELDRGQLAGSVRFLAERWKWSKSRVDRFLNRLKNETMIGTDSGTGILLVSVCNFDKYQRVGLPSGTDSGTASGTDSGTLAGQTRNKETLLKKEPPSAGSPNAKAHSRGRSIDPRNYTAAFEAFWAAYPKTKTSNPKAVAFDVFARLSADDQAAATASLSGFREWVSGQFRGYQPPGAAVYLRQRRFDDFRPAPSVAADPDKVRAGQRTMARLYFSGEWHPNWGAAPGEVGCTIPADVIAEAAQATGKPWPPTLQ
jgi:hypothetical protein